MRQNLCYSLAAILIQTLRCKSLSIDARQHHQIRHALHPGTQLTRAATLRVGLRLSSSSNSEVADGEPQDSSPPQGLGVFGQTLSTIRTAAASFVAGCIGAVILSMVAFNNSLLPGNNDKPSPYQNAALAGPASSSASYERAEKSNDAAEEKQKAVTLYRRILEQLNEMYVDDVDPATLFEVTAKSMLSTLDPYTEYVSPRDVAKRQQLVGIGAFVMKAGNSAEYLDGKPVSELMSRIPSAVALPNQLLPSQDDARGGYRVVLSLQGYAYDAGLRVGDELLEIDNQPVVDDGSTAPITLEKVRDLLNGEPGTKAKLTIKRPGLQDVQTVYVERKPVQFANVPYAGTLSGKGGDIGYIKLRRFGIDAGLETKRAIQAIQEDKLKGLILDLRDNSGGELISAVQTASLFFPDGTYLGSSEGRGSRYPNESYRSGRLDLSQYGIAGSGDSKMLNAGKQIVDPDETKFVILTNDKTASASEFLAGAFQDHDKAVILGSDKSTLGKGIGQREIGMPNKGGALKLTYHLFYTPSGRCVQRQYKEVMKNQIPQGKQKVFFSDNGRPLHDRSGIEVDCKVEPETSLLSSILSSSGAYFDYATDFASKHDVSRDFVVNESVYDDFQKFVVQRTDDLSKYFDNQHLLETIESISAASNAHDSGLIKRSLANLRASVTKDLLNDFQTHKAVIRSELEQNILSRTLPESQLIGRSLRQDALVREAVGIIDDANRYRALLGKSV